VISLKHPATGHEVKTDAASAEFWKAAGYREPAKTAAKRTAKKSTTK
jgi:hypothetical protein